MRIARASLILTFVLCLFAPARARVQDEHVCFGILHRHTSYSDGLGTPDEAYKHALDVAHLDFMAITEHNHANRIRPIAEKAKKDNETGFRWSTACALERASASRRLQDVSIEGNQIANFFEIQRRFTATLSAILAGAVFSMVLYGVFVGGFIKGPLVPEIGDASELLKSSGGTASASLLARWFAVAPASIADCAKLLVWSFLAGFAERLVPHTLEKIAESTGKLADDKAGA